MTCTQPVGPAHGRSCAGASHPRLAQRVRYPKKPELQKVRIRGCDFRHAVLTHQRGRMDVVKQVPASMIEFLHDGRQHREMALAGSQDGNFVECRETSEKFKSLFWLQWLREDAAMRGHAQEFVENRPSRTPRARGRTCSCKEVARGEVRRAACSLALHGLPQLGAVGDIHPRLTHVESRQRRRAPPRRAGTAEPLREKFVHQRGESLAALDRDPLEIRQSPVMEN